MQLIDKKQAAIALDKSLGDVILTRYNFDRGVSNNIKRITVGKGKRLIKKAKNVFLIGKYPLVVFELNNGKNKIKQLLFKMNIKEQMFEYYIDTNKCSGI